MPNSETGREKRLGVLPNSETGMGEQAPLCASLWNTHGRTGTTLRRGHLSHPEVYPGWNISHTLRYTRFGTPLTLRYTRLYTCHTLRYTQVIHLSHPEVYPGMEES